MDYAGSLSWSAILGETDQGTVLSFVKKYTETNSAQLQKAAEGNSRAAANTRNDLRVMCGPPPVKTARLARIRNSLPTADVVAFDSLGIDSTMLGHEYVVILQRFPDHFDDAQFLCEQLFQKVSVEDLVESADEKQRRRSSGESRGQRHLKNLRAGSHNTATSTASKCAHRDNDEVWLDGSDFAEQQSRRGSSASSRGSRTGDASRRRDSTSPARNRRHSSAGSQYRTPSATSRLESAIQAEPLTPRHGSEQSIEEFEREMDSFLEQNRQSCSDGKLNVAPGPGAVHPSQHGEPPTSKSEKLPYVGAASKGGSFLPPLPKFDSSDQRRRSSGSSSPHSKSRGSTRHERPLSSSSADGNGHRRSGRRRSSGSRSGGASSGSDFDDDDARNIRRRSDSGVSHRRHSSSSNRSGSGGQRRRSGSSAGSSAG